MLEFKIGGDSSNFITLRVFDEGRQQAIAPHDDANWLSAEAEIRLGNFQAIERNTLLINDLATFYEPLNKLYTTLSGEAVFYSTEPFIQISIQGNGLGNLQMNCILTSYDNRAELTCQFMLDQSYLAAPLKQLRTILENFPKS